MNRRILQLRPYCAGDIDRFVPRADFQVEKDAVAWTWPDGPPPGRTWTLYHYQSGQGDLTVLGVGGLFPQGSELHAWAVLSELSPLDWGRAIVLARRVLDAASRFWGHATIVATARPSRRGAVRLLKRLGFEDMGPVYDPRLSGVVYQRMERAA